MVCMMTLLHSNQVESIIRMESMYKTGREVKFFAALSKGQSMTRKAVMRRFKLRNPSASVLRFEEAGYTVGRKYSTRTVSGVKIRTVSYKMR